MKRKPKTAYLWVALHGESWAIWKKHGQWVCTEASEHLKWMGRMNATDAFLELNRRRLHHLWQSRELIFPSISPKTSQSAAPRTNERGPVKVDSSSHVKSPLPVKKSAGPTRLAEEWAAIHEGQRPRPCLKTAMDPDGPAKSSPGYSRIPVSSSQPEKMQVKA